MARAVTRGFSLVETLIAAALLSMLSIALVHSVVQIRTLIEVSEEQVTAFWKRQSAIALPSHSQQGQNGQTGNNIAKITQSERVYIDSDNDGLSDSWVERDALLPQDIGTVTKTTTRITWQDGRVDEFISLYQGHQRTDKN